MNSIKRGGMILFAGAIATKLGGIVFRFVSMSQLPPDLYGEVALFLVLFNWLLLLSTFNVTLGLSKKISEKGDRGKYYDASLIGCGLLSLLVGGMAVLLSPLISGFLGITEPLMVVILGLIMPLAVFFHMKMYHYRGKQVMRKSVYMDTSFVLFKIFFLVLLFHYGFNLAPYLSFLLGYLIVDSYLLLQGKFGIDISRTEFYEYFRKILFYSFPIFIAESLRFFGLGLDRIFLARVFDTAASGIFDVGISLCMGYIVIATSFGNALLPSASEKEGDTKVLRRGLGKAVSYVLLLYVVYSAFLFLFGEPLVNFINPEYLGVFEFIGPLMFAYSLVGLFTLLIFFLSGIGMQKYAAYGSIAFVVVAAALNYLLVPVFKYTGAVYAIGGAAVAALVTMVYPVWISLREEKNGKL